MNRHHRVIKKDTPTGEAEYAIYEVCYGKQGNIQLVGDDPACPPADTIAELKEKLEQIRQALDLPVLDMEEVLDSVEESSAIAYGKLIREQMRDTPGEAESPVEEIISLEKVIQTQQKKHETIAAKFAEQRRNDPSDEQ